jgi:hypothetical protein
VVDLAFDIRTECVEKIVTGYFPSFRFTHIMNRHATSEKTERQGDFSEIVGAYKADIEPVDRPVDRMMFVINDRGY